MRSMRFLKYPFGCLAGLLLTSGCTTALLRQGTYVDEYIGTLPSGKKQGDGVKRTDVIKKFSQPYATKIFAPAISVREARKRGVIGKVKIGSMTFEEGSEELKPGTRIARVDQFRFHGQIVSTNAVEGYLFTGELAKYTLGVSEVLLFPLAVWGYASQIGNVHEVKVFYAPGDAFLFQTFARQLSKEEVAKSAR